MNFEKEMKQKYGLNRDWLAAGCYRTKPLNLINRMKQLWPQFTKQEKEHISGVYSFKGGFFEILDNDGEMFVDFKSDRQIELELSKGKNLTKKDYSKKLLQSKELTQIEKAYIKTHICDFKVEKDI